MVVLPICEARDGPGGRVGRSGWEMGVGESNHLLEVCTASRLSKDSLDGKVSC